MSYTQHKSRWIASNIPQLRHSDCTYSEYDFAKLPHIDVEDSLEWLTPLHPNIEKEMLPHRRDPEDRKITALNARTLFSKVDSLGLSLPDAFVNLFESETLQDQFPSWTACYFSLPSEIASDPFQAGRYIVPFLFDQQGCVIWYISMAQQKTPYILASYPIEDDKGGVYYLSTLGDQNPDWLGIGYEQTFVVASSFSSFLYRYWVENCISFKNDLQIALTDNEYNYSQEWKNLNGC